MYTHMHVYPKVHVNILKLMHLHKYIHTYICIYLLRVRFQLLQAHLQPSNQNFHKVSPLLKLTKHDEYRNKFSEIWSRATISRLNNFFFPTCEPQSHFPSFISASGNFHQNFSKVSFIVAIYCAQVSFVADVYGAVTFEKCDWERPTLASMKFLRSQVYCHKV